MNLRKRVAVPIVATIMGIAPPASAVPAERVYQGVTFQAEASGSTINLTILNALTGATGNWANVEYLKAFEIKDIGNVTGASLAGWNSYDDQVLAHSAGSTSSGDMGV